MVYTGGRSLLPEEARGWQKPGGGMQSFIGVNQCEPVAWKHHPQEASNRWVNAGAGLSIQEALLYL